MAGLAEVAGLTTHLTPDVTIEATLPSRAAAIRGAQDVVSTVARFRTVFPVVTLSFVEVGISVDSASTATARAMARTEMQDREGAREADAWEVVLSLERRDGGWVIARATADPVTRQVSIFVTLPNVEGKLIAGLFAEGRVEASKHTGVVVPQSAVDETGAMPMVTRIKNGKAERVPVELGLRQADTEQVEITKGLEAGDIVIRGSAKSVAPGTLVEVVKQDVR